MSICSMSVCNEHFHMMNEALDFVVGEIKINSLCSVGWSVVLYIGRSRLWPTAVSTLSSGTRECLREHVAKDRHYEKISGLWRKCWDTNSLFFLKCCALSKAMAMRRASLGVQLRHGEGQPKGKVRKELGPSAVKTPDEILPWEFSSQIHLRPCLPTQCGLNLLTWNPRFLLKLLDEKKKEFNIKITYLEGNFPNSGLVCLFDQLYSQVQYKFIPKSPLQRKRTAIKPTICNCVNSFK